MIVANHLRGSKRPAGFILLAGFITGTLDIIAACIDFYISTGRGPEVIFRYIASGMFGRKAYAPGESMIACGLFFHYLIAFGLAAFFAWLYLRLGVIRRHPVVAGICYGIFAWLITTQVIIPFSRIHPPPAEPVKVFKAIIILIFMIGLPLSGLAQWYWKKR